MYSGFRNRGCSDLRDNLTTLDLLALPYPCAALLEMSEIADLAVAMIEHHVVATKCHLACGHLLFVEGAIIRQPVMSVDNHAVGGGVYRLAEAEPALVVFGVAAVPLQWPVGVALLRTELSLGLTFSGIALQSDNPEKTARNTANARKAFDVALRLIHKIILTTEEKSETDAGLAKLKADLVKLGENI